jgi:hypothetical protein
MLVADVKLKWSPSPSGDITKQVVEVVIDGTPALESEVSPEITNIIVEVKASQSVIFRVHTTGKAVNGEDKTVVSEQYTFQVGDLEDPLPAFGLGHEVVAVRDVPDEEVPPVEEPV